MAKIYVICGGESDEREVSLRSGAAVAKALTQAGHDITVFDTSAHDDELVGCDAVFPVLHGEGGEDGAIQTRLESLGLRYVGTNPDASALCMDKAAYRQKMVAAGFTMASGHAVTAEEFAGDPLVANPYVLKPINGGSTIDTFIVHAPENADQAAISTAFSEHGSMMLEELIEGDEITVGVLGKQALPVIEIIPPAGGEFDYENKYNGKTQELCPPVHVAEDLQRQAQNLAEQIHSAAGCRDMSRTDFIIRNDGSIYLLETNTIPGMTSQSLYPKMAATAGISFPDLCDRLVQMALSR